MTDKMNQKTKGFKRHLCYPAYIISMVFLVLLGSQAYASEKQMTITGIYLEETDQNKDGKDLYGGDATLVESGGEYLLMDCGADQSAKRILSCLRKEGVDEISIYISHLHGDHYGGFKAILNSEIKVDQVYVPYVSMDPHYSENGLYYSDLMKAEITDPARKKGCEIIGLFHNPGAMLDPASTSASGSLTYEDLVDQYASIFSFGDTVVRILGPYTSKDSIADCSTNEYGSASDHYLNNRSLVAQLSDGVTSFLTAGDMEKAEENLLLAKYGKESSSRLKADIFKLSRHGLESSNSAAFLEAVSPTWTFGMNSAYTGKRSTLSNKGVKVRMTHQARINASNYGLVYMVGDEKQDFKIVKTGSSASLYRGSEKLSGLVRLEGSYGTGITWNQYYLAANGKPKTGVQTIDGKLYYFGKGGCQVMGILTDQDHKTSYAKKIEGSKYYYNPVISSNGKKRYYSNIKTGAMATGFKTLLEKNLYYFSPKDGYCLVGKGSDNQYSVVKIADTGYAYAIKNNGLIRTTTGKVKILDKNYAYVGESHHSALESGWNENFYYSPTTYLRCGSPIQFSSLKYDPSAGGNVLTWTQATKANGYYIYRADSYDGDYKQIKKINGKDTQTFTNKSVDAGKTYFYKIRPFLTVTIGDNSNHYAGAYTGIKGVLDVKLEDFKVTAKTGKVSISWTKAKGADGYQIYQKSGDKYQKAVQIDKQGSQSKTISDLKSGKAYSFKMRAYKKVGKKTVYSPYTKGIKVTVK